ncbi:MAG: hypothetical protein CL536_01535 [Alcaligenaceae bacterium]|nr:hypothetical protein [Alcaligenaceae bacterium]
MMPEIVPTILLPANRVDIFKANLEAYLKGKNGPGSGSEPGLHLVAMELDPTSATTSANATTAAPTRLRTRTNATTRDVIVRRGPNLRTHVVRKGDTLYDLARRYSTSVGELRRLNNLKSTHLKLGQRLRVPGTDVQG